MPVVIAAFNRDADPRVDPYRDARERRCEGHRFCRTACEVRRRARRPVLAGVAGRAAIARRRDARRARALGRRRQPRALRAAARISVHRRSRRCCRMSAGGVPYRPADLPAPRGRGAVRRRRRARRRHDARVARCGSAGRILLGLRAGPGQFLGARQMVECTGMSTGRTRTRARGARRTDGHRAIRGSASTKPAQRDRRSTWRCARSTR